MDQYGHNFKVGQLVESVFDKDTIYQITELHPPTHAGDYSTYLSLAVFICGVDSFQYGVSDRKGRMADGRSYAPYHFNLV